MFLLLTFEKQISFQKTKFTYYSAIFIIKNKPWQSWLKYKYFNFREVTEIEIENGFDQV